MGKNNQRAKCAKQVVVQECMCHHCGREFRTRDLRLGQKMLKLHLLKEHNSAGENITDYGHCHTSLKKENSNGHCPFDYGPTTTYNSRT